MILYGLFSIYHRRKFSNHGFKQSGQTSRIDAIWKGAEIKFEGGADKIVLSSGQTFLLFMYHQYAQFLNGVLKFSSAIWVEEDFHFECLIYCSYSNIVISTNYCINKIQIHKIETHLPLLSEMSQEHHLAVATAATNYANNIIIWWDRRWQVRAQAVISVYQQYIQCSFCL